MHTTHSILMETVLLPDVRRRPRSLQALIRTLVQGSTGEDLYILFTFLVVGDTKAKI